MKTRFKQIRSKLGLSQEEFGNKLGVTKSTISNIENGRFNITDTMIKLLCSEFRVNEDWLRTGAGGDENIFVPDDAQKYVELGRAARTPNDFRTFLTHVMETLPDEYCDYLYEEFVKFQKNIKKGNS